METNTFLKIGKHFHTAYGGNDIDFVDQLNYQYSTGLLFIFISIIGFRQYVGKPIQCWVPQQFTKSWEEYAENLCWIQSTYKLLDNEDIPEDDFEIHSLKYISYYQWVAIVMGGQAIMSYLPHLIWRLWSKRLPILLKTAREASIPDREMRAKAIQCIVTKLEEGTEAQIRYRRGEPGIFTRYVFFCFNPSTRLTILFLFVRTLFILNNIGQIYLMKNFIKTNNTWFGIKVISDLLKGYEWKDYGNFPRITYCTINVRKFGQIKQASHTFQCVLPINHFVEKIYVFLWLWFTLLAVLTTLNTLQWGLIVCLPWKQTQFIQRYLKALKLISNSEGRECQRFVARNLGCDGIFVLQAVSKVSSDLIALDVTATLWTNYRQAKLNGAEDDITRYMETSLKTNLNIV